MSEWMRRMYEFAYAFDYSELGWATLSVVLAFCSLGLIAVGLHLSYKAIRFAFQLLRLWGEAHRMKKEEERRQRELMSEGLRMMVETMVSSDQLTRNAADEWYRKYSRLMIPDLLPPGDYVKAQIKKRRAVKSAPLKFVDMVDLSNYVPKGVSSKKKLIAGT